MVLPMSTTSLNTKSMVPSFIFTLKDVKVGGTMSAMYIVTLMALLDGMSATKLLATSLRSVVAGSMERKVVLGLDASCGSNFSVSSTCGLKMTDICWDSVTVSTVLPAMCCEKVLLSAAPCRKRPAGFSVLPFTASVKVRLSSPLSTFNENAVSTGRTKSAVNKLGLSGVLGTAIGTSLVSSTRELLTSR